MEQLLHKYLSHHYFIDTSDVGNDGIYKKDDTRRYKAPFYGNKLLDELNLIFNLEKGYLQSNVDKWALSIKEDVDLEWYWLQEDFFTFPYTERIFARTVGQDLVSVQPLSAPSSQLMYLDYDYGTGTSETVAVNVHRGNDRYTQEGFISGAIVFNDYINTFNLGELDHPTSKIEININERNDSLVYKVLQKWNKLIGVSSRKG